jgi:hypothetical protein
MLLVVSIKDLDYNEMAIMYDTIKKELLSVKESGLYNGPPFFKWIIFPAVFTKMTINLNCMSNDGLPINIQVSFQHIANKTHLKQIAYKYRDNNKYNEIITYSAQDAVQKACAIFNISNITNYRSLIQTEIENNIIMNLNYIYVNPVSVQIERLNFKIPININQQEEEQQAIQDALIINQTASATIKSIQNIAIQNSTAIIQQYAAIEEVLLSMMSDYKLNFTGLITFLKNKIILNTRNIDLALNT